MYLHNYWVWYPRKTLLMLFPTAIPIPDLFHEVAKYLNNCIHSFSNSNIKEKAMDKLKSSTIPIMELKEQYDPVLKWNWHHLLKEKHTWAFPKLCITCLLANLRQHLANLHQHPFTTFQLIFLFGWSYWFKIKTSCKSQV